MSSSRHRSLQLVKRWEHHTFSGGYDRLAKGMAGDWVSRRRAPILGNRAARFIWKRCTPTNRYLIDYAYEDWLAEWRVLARARLQPPELVHVLYGDDQLDVLLRYRRLLPCPLVATFHQPTHKLRKRFELEQKHLLRGLDAAIVVAQSQMPDFQRWLGPDRVFFVPHGVDTRRFCPGETRARSAVVRLITVGDHMRDWEALHRIADECRHLKLPVEIDAVVRPHCHSYFSGCTNVRLHVDIPEDRLIDLYRSADALLLPLADATANNAILEALACGTPVISSNVGGIPDYVDPASGWLFPQGEVDAIVALIRQIGEHREVASVRRASARAKALEFDWQQVCGQVLSVYALRRNGIQGVAGS
jgi:glycosyltransferase involved in cell wall biosynthesis